MGELEKTGLRSMTADVALRLQKNPLAVILDDETRIPEPPGGHHDSQGGDTPSPQGQTRDRRGAPGTKPTLGDYVTSPMTGMEAGSIFGYTNPGNEEGH